MKCFIFVLLLVIATSQATYGKKERHHHVKNNDGDKLKEEKCEVLCTPFPIPEENNKNNSTEEPNDITTESSNTNSISNSTESGVSTTSGGSSEGSGADDSGSGSGGTIQPIETTPSSGSKSKKRNHHHTKKHYVNEKDFHKIVKKYHKYSKGHVNQHNRAKFPDNCRVFCVGNIGITDVNIADDEDLSKGTPPDYVKVPEYLTVIPTTEAAPEDKKRRNHHKSQGKHN